MNERGSTMKSLPRTDAPKPVGVWIRVSTEDQARGESPEHHERRARAYAEMRGWPVEEVYRLEGVSGKLVSQHPEAQRMLKDIRSGRIQGLIFSKLARLARNTKELLEFADIFRGCGADLVSLQESIDTSTPAGLLFYTMIAAMAQWEREEITERVNASVPIRAKLHKPLGGAAPYGYQWKDKQLVIHPEEGPIRRLMYEMFAELGRKKAVATELNKKGYRTRKGAPFCAATVDRLLRDTTAKGLHRTNYTRRTDDDTAWELKPESDWVFHEVPRLVPVELWEQCNQRLGAAPMSNGRPAKRAVHLFAGVTFCRCGNKMYVPTNSPKYVCGECRMKIPADDLEAIFVGQLEQFLVSPTEIDAYLGRAASTLEEKQALLESRKKEAEKVRRDSDRTYQLFLDRELDQKPFSRLFKPLEERQRQLEEELPKLQAEIDFLTVNSISADQIVSDANFLQETWPTLERDEKRKIVECITKRITVSKEEIDIELCYLPSSKDMTKRDWSLGGSNP